MEENVLYYGDNLDILRRYIKNVVAESGRQIPLGSDRWIYYYAEPFSRNRERPVWTP